MSQEHESSTKYLGHYGNYFPGYVMARNTKLNLCIHDFAHKTTFLFLLKEGNRNYSKNSYREQVIACTTMSKDSLNA